MVYVKRHFKEKTQESNKKQNTQSMEIESNSLTYFGRQPVVGIPMVLFPSSRHINYLLYSMHLIRLC